MAIFSKIFTLLFKKTSIQNQYELRMSVLEKKVKALTENLEKSKLKSEISHLKLKPIYSKTEQASSPNSLEKFKQVITLKSLLQHALKTTDPNESSNPTYH